MPRPSCTSIPVVRTGSAELPGGVWVDALGTRLVVGLVLLFALGVCFPSTPLAQEWPTKPIRLIVANSAGSGTDVIFRTYTPALAEALGQPVVVENRVSAGGIVALQAVAQAAPDGYTLLGSAGTNMVVGPLLFKRVAELTAGIVPVAPTARTTVLLIARPGLPARTVGELVMYAKSHPGKLNFGSAGVTTLAYIQGEMLLRAANIEATHVPYKDAGRTLLIDMYGDRIDFTFDAGVAIPYVKAGKLRLLAIVGTERSMHFPDVPTLSEAGFDITGSPPQGVYAPGGTPRAVIQRLHSEINRIMHTGALRKALGSLGAEPVLTGSPGEFASQLRRDQERFATIVREANIRVE
jgi:tripartite-type tricarboxylate transporter receptor subunit TctC